MRKILIILCLLFLLLVSVTPVSAKKGGPPYCQDINDKVKISSINPEYRTITVVYGYCWQLTGTIFFYWSFQVIKSTQINISGQKDQGSFEDLSTEGQEITYSYYYDSEGVRTADKITIFFLE